MIQEKDNQSSFQSAKFCPGCGHPLVLMILDQVLEELGLQEQAVLGLDIGCSLLALNSLPINTFHTHHGRVTPTMVGFKRGNSQAICLGYTGDGGAYAIGLQSLLHAALRDEPITVIVINNTVYGMTGGQQSPTTFLTEKTDTTPAGNQVPPLLGVELAAQIASQNAYLARGAVTDLLQLKEMVKKAIQAQQAGHFSLVEALSFCPTNWKTTGPETAEFLKNNLLPIFPVGEIKK